MASNTSNLSYFICTLGEAQENNVVQHFDDVNQLIDAQATKVPDLPAIGFYETHKVDERTSFQHQILTFKELRHAVDRAAGIVSGLLARPKGETVGLLCSSSPEFLMTWLACVRLGHPVLLIAPQCAPAGIRHLCEESRVKALLVDDKNAELGESATQQTNGAYAKTHVQLIPFNSSNILEDVRSDFRGTPQSADTDGTRIAYLHHTSGTSSGVPKSIPQSHHGAVGALPALNGRARAMFTTTPLYHGGPADIFRAWTSEAMIWLFPSHRMPITPLNIVRCLECAQGAAEKGMSPAISYFAAVPYVLQMMAEDVDGEKWLKRMDMVGVGGAALPKEIGDELTNRGVNLVSRFGSAECGYLLSSHRDYKNDKDWQYLRLPKNVTQLRFETRDDGLGELVVLPKWPHMAKRNRKDGSYATSDLFEPHPSLQNAWKYHSRADAQLTLITGKKFDPEPAEAAMVAASEHVADVLVFGNDKPYPGALLFRSEQSSSISDDELLRSLAPVTSRLDDESESHARISPSMLVPMPHSEDPLPKSSKGSVIRHTAEETYSNLIDEAYHSAEELPARDISDEEVPEAVAGIVRGVLADKVTMSEDTEFFALGVDSLAAMRIRHKLRQLLPESTSRLPISIVEDTGSIKKLGEYIISLRHGGVDPEGCAKKKYQHDYMRQLVEEYSKFTKPSSFGSAVENGQGETVVLTGATGALGAHVLHQLQRNPRVARIFCLVRGVDEHAAYERVDKALQHRQMPKLEVPNAGVEVVVIQAVLREQDLGLSETMYNQIAREATVIMHLAWSVNFRMKLQNFAKESIASVQNLINLALASPRRSCPKLMFCSSVASAMAYTGAVVPEKILDDPASATNLGYSQSKWVAEQICDRASQLPRLRNRVSIFRVGQLSGDTRNGIWNVKEAWPMLLSSVKLTGVLPDLDGQILDWLPVDIAAAAMIEGSLTDISNGQEVNLYHLLNDNLSATWSDLLVWLGKRYEFDSVQPAQWLHQLEIAAERGSQHSALQLLDHWKSTYEDDKDIQKKSSRAQFATSVSKEVLPSTRSVKPVDEPYFEKLWMWIDANM